MYYQNESDETLVMLTLAGEQSAYEVLVIRYQKAVIASAITITKNHFSVWKPQIQQYAVRAMGGDHFQRAAAAVDDDHVIAVRGQHRPQEGAYARIVLHDQYLVANLIGHL